MNAIYDYMGGDWNSGRLLYYWYSSLLKREIEVASLECYYQLCLKLVEY